MELSLKLFTGCNLFTAALFIFMNATVTPQALADWDATHPSASPVASDALAKVICRSHAATRVAPTHAHSAYC